MKRIFVIALTALSFTGIAATYAQDQAPQTTQANAKQRKTPEEKAQALTQRMTSNLGLTADQTAKVQAINLDKTQKLAALKTKYAGDRKQGFQEGKAIRQEWDSELKAVLSADQYTKYQQNKEELKAAHKGKRKHRKAGA
jgi:periplasmic protein CpxP/Spy